MGKVKRTKKLLKVAKILKKHVITGAVTKNKNNSSPQNEPSKKIVRIIKRNSSKPKSNKVKRQIAARESER